jgi:hypothetical protein
LQFLVNSRHFSWYGDYTKNHSDLILYLATKPRNPQQFECLIKSKFLWKRLNLALAHRIINETNLATNKDLYTLLLSKFIHSDDYEEFWHELFSCLVCKASKAYEHGSNKYLPTVKWLMDQKESLEEETILDIILIDDYELTSFVIKRSDFQMNPFYYINQVIDSKCYASLRAITDEKIININGKDNVILINCIKTCNIEAVRILLLQSVDLHANNGEAFKEASKTKNKEMISLIRNIASFKKSIRK